MRRDIRIERRYRHSPEAVWRWLANRDAMADWLMPNTFEPVVGHRFEFRTKPAPGFDGIVHCQVRELDPPRRLTFTWVGGGIDTVVSFDLIPDGGGTLLRLSHTGFGGAKGVLLSYMLGNGWNGMLTRKLPALLDADTADLSNLTGPEGPGYARPEDSGCGDKTRFWRLFDRVFSR